MNTLQGFFNFHNDALYFAVRIWQIRGISIYLKCIDTPYELFYEELNRLAKEERLAPVGSWLVRFEGTYRRVGLTRMSVHIERIIHMESAEPWWKHWVLRSPIRFPHY
jgi:hypothetical protein